jgi:two-component system LytT family sensor kinase
MHGFVEKKSSPPVLGRINFYLVNMYVQLNKNQWKYFKIELLFFVIFFYLFPILTDIEYSFREQHNAALFIKDITYRLVYGTVEILAFAVLYKIVQHYLVKKRVLLFLLFTLIFLAGYHFYFKAIYYIVGHTQLFPVSMHNQALSLSNQKNRLNFSIIYIFIQFICISALAYFVRSTKQDEQMQQLKEQQLATELNYLKAQLHPHFFFNTMNNIYSLALKNSKHTAPLVAKLADMMRYILYEADQQKVPLTKEIQFLSNYIKVEQIRHPKNIQIEFDVQGTTENIDMEPLLLLPFIENAFKHGLQEETGEGFVNIVICKTEQELLLQVINSYPTAKHETEKGIGLQNAGKRLALLYPGKYQLSVKANEATYEVNLTLQIQ